MGIAAYNRGSKAISNYIFPNDVRPKHSTKMERKDNLPEGVLRSGFLPDNFLAGTALFLTYKRGWYFVGTRWQYLKRRRKLEVAVELFENLQLYGSAAL